MYRLTLLTIGLLLAAPALPSTMLRASGQARYVAPGGDDTGNDCSDEADPCATISYAIGWADAGGTIEIADGTYTEPDGLDIDKDLVLQGESEAGTVIQAHTEPNEASSRVITITGAHEVEIINLTLRHGVATTSDLDGQGGGIHNDGTALTLANVTLTENRALYGGGMLSHSGATLTNVTFNENEAGGFGGGMYDNGGSTTLSNVTFSGNTANGSGGGMIIQGGSPSLTNVVFSGNVVESAAYSGGGIYNGAGSLTLTNATLSGNSAGDRGGGIYNNGETPAVLTNTIVWGNTAEEEGNEIYNNAGSTATLSYSLYGNGEGDIGGEGEFTAENSLTEDPLFADADGGDLHLMEGSPAIDTGDPDTDPLIFPTDANGDPVDLDGNPRFFSEEVDMGPYEWNPNVADEAGPGETAEGLGVPYPNPASMSTSLRLRVPESQHMTVAVFDALGRRVATLYDGTLVAGTAETLTLDASALPAGVYIIRAIGEKVAESRRVTVVR